jgi:methylated-DNA-[protein]-cysteine S-methyltransferase
MGQEKPVESVTVGDFSYVLVPSAFGTLSIVWRGSEAGPKVYHAFLPDERTPMQEVVQMAFPGADQRSCPAIAGLAARVQRFLDGDAVRFDLGLVALDRCSGFQRGVLLAEHQIPRGWVSTYGRIARRLEVPGGARAVGGALSRNPFPIIVPCHRAIRSDGQLGGFQGGLWMKQGLLELEGVEVTPAGKVRTDRFYY